MCCRYTTDARNNIPSPGRGESIGRLSAREAGSRWLGADGALLDAYDIGLLNPPSEKAEGGQLL